MRARRTLSTSALVIRGLFLLAMLLGGCAERAQQVPPLRAAATTAAPSQPIPAPPARSVSSLR
ncbi:MAG: hypothetical protein IPO81_20290 [Kouleothrix sp.]|nr:hypothetical protein [Kouleothrix sp.]